MTRIFKLHLVLAEKFKQYYLNIVDGRFGPLMSSRFFDTLFLATLAPHQLGFATSNPSQVSKLASLTQRLCRALVSILPATSERRQLMISKFSRHMEKDQFNFMKYLLNHNEIEVERTRNLARGYQILHATGILFVSHLLPLLLEALSYLEILTFSEPC